MFRFVSWFGQLIFRWFFNRRDQQHEITCSNDLRGGERQRVEDGRLRLDSENDNIEIFVRTEQLKHDD